MLAQHLFNALGQVSELVVTMPASPAALRFLVG